MRTSRFITLTAITFCIGLPAWSAPLNLADVPLQVGFEPAPNVVFLIDDSGSMGWGTIDENSTNDGQIRITASGTASNQNCNYAHALPYSVGGLNSATPPPVGSSDTVGFWRARSWHANRLYYNPEFTYTPWEGEDDADVTFTNADPEAARIDASDNNGSTVDLTGTVTFNPPCDGNIDTNNDGNLTTADEFEGNLTFKLARYHVWDPANDDANSNGRPDASENHVLVEITDKLDSYFVNEAGVDRTQRTDCAGYDLDTGVNASNGCTKDEELQNFANWFQFYRTRLMTAKAAYTQAVAESENGAYIGIVTLHNNNSNNTQVLDITDPAEKLSLLEEITTIRASGGTPLRDRMNKACRYLACDSDNSFGNACPALSPTNQGGNCQKNFLIVMTDGYYNQSFSGLGNHDGDDDSIWDGDEYGDQESNSLADIAMKFFEEDIHPSADYNNIVNDVIKPAVGGVPAVIANHQHITTYTVAFGVRDGLTQAQIDDLEKTTPKMPDDQTSNPWPTDIVNNPTDSNPQEPLFANRITDLRHAAFNGRGKFLSAADPGQLKAALKEILAEVTLPSTSAASLGSVRSSITTGGFLYQTIGNPNDWSGNLLARPVSTGKAVNDPKQPNHPNCFVTAANTADYPSLTIGSPLPIGEPCPAAWEAATVMNGQNWNTQRQIITRQSDLGYAPEGASGLGVTFRWGSNNNPLITRQQRRALRYSHEDRARNPGAVGRDRLDYIRGRTDINGFRARSTVLGDILDSGAIFIGPPAFAYDFGDYATFKSNNANRSGVVYTGGNDGMLHAINASDGTERFAYIPGDRFVWRNLSRLTEERYSGINHRYFVNGQAVYVDAQVGGSAVNGSLTGASWKSLLAGGLGNGGQTIYLLDVTDTSGFDEDTDAASTLKWEFSDLDDPALGFTHSTPSIARMANGKWAVIVGNGYNNCKDDADHDNGRFAVRNSYNNADTFTATCTAAIFILYVDGPSGTNADGAPVWVEGTDYFKVTVTGGDANNPNGMATPIAVDLDADSRVDYIYAGDTLGQMWRFDVTSTTDSNWASNSNAPVKIFQALNDAGDIQPISARPEVVAHPTGVNKGVIVLFGTGRYLVERDGNANNDEEDDTYPVQSFYGIWDDLSDNYTPPDRDDTFPNSATLVLAEQEILAEVQFDGETTSNGQTFGTTAACDNTQNCFRIVTENDVNLATDQHRGWYLDLFNTENNNTDNDGERAITNPLIRGDRVVFTTLLPRDDANLCSTGGDGWLMEIDMFSGGAPSEPVFDTNGDGVVDKDDKLEITVDGNTQYISPAGGIKFDNDKGLLPAPAIIIDPISNIEKKCFPRADGEMTCILEANPNDGRLSWREIH